MSSSSPPFGEGTRVLCFHGPLIYEAKIEKVSKDDRYFIHYHGWKRHWDEWVSEARLLIYNEANLRRKQELIDAHQARMKARKNERNSNANATSLTHKRRNVNKNVDEPVAKKGAVEPPEESNATASTTTTTTTSTTTTTTDTATTSSESNESVRTRSSSRKSSRPTSTTAKKNAKKVQVSIRSSPHPQSGSLDTEKAAEACVESAEQFYTKVEIRVELPEALKPLLVDDWDYITRQRKLLVLPARINVDKLIQEYKEYRLSDSSDLPQGSSSAVLEVTTGLKEYFNVMLGSQLLYKFEREQYADVLRDHPELSVSSIYGPIHLLRLFVKLGGMLTYTPLDVKSVEILQYYLQDFLLYMAKNMNSLFQLQDYGTATPEYHRRAL